jgi:hypothetical protein
MGREIYPGDRLSGTGDGGSRQLTHLEDGVHVRYPGLQRCRALTASAGCLPIEDVLTTAFEYRVTHAGGRRAAADEQLLRRRPAPAITAVLQLPEEYVRR